MAEKKITTTAARLREAMEAANKKPVDLVRETGLDKSAVSRYLSGKYEPKSTAISKLAICLGVSEMWLWGYDVPRDRAPEQKKNDAIAGAVVKMRKDPRFFNVVSMLAELPDEEFDNIAGLISALSNK